MVAFSTMRQRTGLYVKVLEKAHASLYQHYMYEDKREKLYVSSSHWTEKQ